MDINAYVRFIQQNKPTPLALKDMLSTLCVYFFYFFSLSPRSAKSPCEICNTRHLSPCKNSDKAMKAQVKLKLKLEETLCGINKRRGR